MSVEVQITVRRPQRRDPNDVMIEHVKLLDDSVAMLEQLAEVRGKTVVNALFDLIENGLETAADQYDLEWPS